MNLRRAFAVGSKGQKVVQAVVYTIIGVVILAAVTITTIP